jgi:hypothetical protein
MCFPIELYINYVTHRGGGDKFDPQGHDLYNFSTGPQGDATWQISKLWTLLFMRKGLFLRLHFLTYFSSCDLLKHQTGTFYINLVKDDMRNNLAKFCKNRSCG